MSVHPLRRGSFIALALMLALGCTRSDPRPPDTPTAEATTPITVVDDAQRTVTLARPAQRIISLAPSQTELLWAIGAGSLLVGRTPFCDYPPAASEVRSVGSLFPPDYERIIGAQPDLVVMLDGSVDARHRLEKYGLSVVVVQPRTLGEIGDAMRLLGRLTGRESPAATAAQAFEDRLGALSRPTRDGPRVFYEVGADPLYGAGPKSFIGDLIRHAGGVNALVGGAEWPQVSTEQLIAADPQVIIVGSAKRRAAIVEAAPAGWITLAAIRAGAVYAAPDTDLFARFGPRVLDGLEWLTARLASPTP